MDRKKELKELFSLSEQLTQLKTESTLSEREKTQRREELRRRAYYHEMRMHVHDCYLLLSFLRKSRWKFWWPHQWIRAQTCREVFLNLREKFEALLTTNPFFYEEEKDLSKREKVVLLKRELQRARDYIEDNGYKWDGIYSRKENR